MHINSKLPNVGATIFATMSKMAKDYNALNLSQGFPDFPVSPELIEGVHHYMKAGFNQYPPMTGMPQLRERIADKIEKSFGAKVNVETEITLTAGAIEAINATITTLVSKGDEVIMMVPAYDAYDPIITQNGGITIPIALTQPHFAIDLDTVREKVNAKTRMIIINSPHNPTGAMIDAGDLSILAEITRDTNIIVLSDEVYEHIVFDGRAHESILKHEELRQRSVATFSFGKTFHATGWRIGYMVAPDWITAEVRKVHQYMAFAVHTPSQLAIADYLEDADHYNNLGAFYQQKRDLFLDLIKGSRFESLPSNGTYFQLLSYKNISEKPDLEMAEWLTKEKGIASIPISVFYDTKEDNRMLRFCFAKSEETLTKAAEILCAI
ncbi:methionine aminotransferase [Roseivirga echinicomitans]|uniref:Aminotransferase n=1 Tax=Roseivirga echinicomitans TaxID=296218 RepID=A0A150X139_9BACT|nr:methionine aminotransferase [Roseivirga echinicomitans]KYG72440.1 aminotransferase [Roseivirga echinicomitans]